MKRTVIARRYASAFLKSIHKDSFEECFKDFEVFVALYFGYEEFANILSRPGVKLEKKVSFLKKIFGGRAEKKVIDFISLLIKKNRISLLERIAEEVERAYRKEKGITGLLIKSAVELLPEERKKLVKVLEKKFGKIQIREVIDPTILGGLVICFSDQVVDASISAKLKHLKELMIHIDNEWLAALMNQPTLAI